MNLRLAKASKSFTSECRDKSSKETTPVRKSFGEKTHHSLWALRVDITLPSTQRVSDMLSLAWYDHLATML